MKLSSMLMAGLLFSSPADARETLKPAPHQGDICYSASDEQSRPPARSDFAGFLSNPFGAYCQANRECAADATGEGASCTALVDYRNFLGAYDDLPVDVAPDAEQHQAAFCEKASSYRRVDAVDAILQAAKDKRLVLINEVHDQPETRILTRGLLARMRRAGFSYLAVEALNEGSGELKKLTTTSGYYTLEPAFAAMIKTALNLGFKVVAYDAVDDVDPLDIASREQGQAENIARLLKFDPDARVIVHAGLAHIYEKAGGYLAGNEPMAMRLKAASGVDPLTVDQVYSFDALTTGACKAMSVPAGLHVFEGKDGTPISLVPGQFDVSVLAVRKQGPDVPDFGLDGRSDVLNLEATRCRSASGCLVQIFDAQNAGEDAVPVVSFIRAEAAQLGRPGVPLPGHYVVRIHSPDGSPAREMRVAAVPGDAL